MASPVYAATAGLCAWHLLSAPFAGGWDLLWGFQNTQQQRTAMHVCAAGSTRPQGCPAAQVAGMGASRAPWTRNSPPYRHAAGCHPRRGAHSHDSSPQHCRGQCRILQRRAPTREGRQAPAKQQAGPAMTRPLLIASMRSALCSLAHHHQHSSSAMHAECHG